MDRKDSKRDAGEGSLDELLNPHREEERDHAASATADRLRLRGVRVDDRDSPEGIVAVLEAVERFELAVQSHGGDLMVDEPPVGNEAEPDDPAFVIPERAPSEAAETFASRIDDASARIRSRDEK